MTILHLVSHTHWDREWYLTFQQFRLKLVHLIDELLELLASDPAYKHFTLDGQTVVLDDYLAMRPEREADLCAYVQSGRLLIGPWHVLPDEFLVSPEATVRNLLQGERTARRFGPKMQVGYTPDPFGHIGQMPQILRGFGIQVAAFQRGLSDEPCEVWWQAPDGSRVLAAYLRDGYGNAALLPTSTPDRFVSEVCRARDSLVPHAAAGHILLMHGTDHMEPPPDTTVAIAYAQDKLDGDRLVHSTLPAYLSAAQHTPRTVVMGELRCSKRHHLLPGVLSTRMWIKQRNHACETLLEKWAEPFSAWVDGLVDDRAGALAYARGRLVDPAPVIRQAWRLLMECHPHDSICGCSIDQVHDEMRVRFDQVEQIGEEIVRQSLDALASGIGTQLAAANGLPLVVFNPVAGPRTDLVTLQLQLPAGMQEFEIVDEMGSIWPHQIAGSGGREVASMSLDRDGLRSMLGLIQEGRIPGMVIRDVGFRREASTLFIDVVLVDSGQPDPQAIELGGREIEKSLADDTLSTFVIHARSAAASTVQFVARDVPGYGYRTAWLQSAPSACTSAQPTCVAENEFFVVEACADDGTLSVRDKRTGGVYSGLNRFVDGGDCGDEYNYCPPAQDSWGTTTVQAVRCDYGEACHTIEVALTLHVPSALEEGRQARCADRIPLSVTTRASVSPGVPRVDIVTEVNNTARDHRLRVHFPAPFAVTSAEHDGHFQVVRRPLGLPAFDDTWVEQPRPEAPHRAFTAVSNGTLGLMVANRGLPEVEVLQAPGGEGGAEIALTLLRCVGWLSRDDFPTRTGHAGPPLATPGAQMPGRHRFEYAIIPYGSDRPHQQAYAFAAPMRAVATDSHAADLPCTGALVRIAPAEFVVSAIKRAEDGHGLIVRGYNIGAEAIQVRLTPWRRFARVARARLDETDEAELEQEGVSGVTFAARGHEIVTLRFQFDV